MKETTALDLMAKYFTREITPEEELRLMRWVNDSAANQSFFSDASQLWGAIETVEPEVMVVDSRVAWQEFETKLKASETPIVDFSSRRKWWPVAAAILLLLGIGLTWQQFVPSHGMQWVEVVTVSGEFRQLRLPDNSRVLLEENSYMSYPESFSERKIKLKGAARFSVSSDPESPFTITAGEVKTTVLGTQFSVRAYPEDGQVSVEVTEGLVEVTTGGVSGVLPQTRQIAGGQGVVYQKQQKELIEGPPPGPNEASWLTGRLVFVDNPLREVIGELEVLYQIDLDLANPGIKNCPVSIEFDQVEFDQALEDLSFIMGLDVKQNQSGVFVLSGTSCTE